MTLKQAMPTIRSLAMELALAPMASGCTCGHVCLVHANHGRGACAGRTGGRQCRCQVFQGWYPNRARDFERFGRMLVTLLNRQATADQRAAGKMKKSKKGR